MAKSYADKVRDSYHKKISAMATAQVIEPKPEPLVAGARYCLSCGRACLTVTMHPHSTLVLANVGTAASACCGERTALLLIPTSTAEKPRFPRAIPHVVGMVPTEER